MPEWFKGLPKAILPISCLWLCPSLFLPIDVSSSMALFYLRTHTEV